MEEEVLEPEPRKMFVVVRADLPPGLQMAQAGHAIAELCFSYGDTAKGLLWYESGEGHLIVLSVPSELDLIDAKNTLQAAGIICEPFNEPDLDMQLTAFACFCAPEDNYLFCDLPLALRRRSLFQRVKDYLGVGPLWSSDD